MRWDFIAVISVVAVLLGFVLLVRIADQTRRNPRE